MKNLVFSNPNKLIPRDLNIAKRTVRSMHPLSDLEMHEVFYWLRPFETCFKFKSDKEERVKLAEADAQKEEDHNARVADVEGNNG